MIRGRAKEPYWGTVLEAPDPQALARFYSDLLGWPIVTDRWDWVTVKPPDGYVYLAFQLSDGYVPPAWPAEPGKQRITMHLDVEVEDLETSVADAVALGATVAEFQPQENVRVLFDPAGHPFCLYLDESAGTEAAAAEARGEH